MKLHIRQIGIIGWIFIGMLLVPLTVSGAPSCETKPAQDRCCDFIGSTDASYSASHCEAGCLADPTASWCSLYCTVIDGDATFCGATGTIPTSSSGDLNLENEPMFLSGYADPNIIFTIDDSGSMTWEMMPEEITKFNYLYPNPSNVYNGSIYTYGNYLPNFNDTNYYNYTLRSVEINKIYYNPDTEYEPWIKHDGTSFDDADPVNAYYNPTDTDKGGLNLTEEQTESAYWHDGNDYARDGLNLITKVDHTYWPITYYVYNAAADNDNDKADRTDYYKVSLRVSPDDATDPDIVELPDGLPRSREDEIKNFANWFSYYRSRILLTRAAASLAFADLPATYRIGFAAVNYSSSEKLNEAPDNTYLYESNDVMVTGVDFFSGTVKEDFYDNLFNTYGSGTTPLRNAMYRVGQYYDYSSGDYADLGPWSDTPSINDGEEVSDAELCRRSFNITMTDGYYNGTAPTTSLDTLGKIASYFFDNDLQPAISTGSYINKVSILDEDGDNSHTDADEDFDDYGDNPGTRPHMTNFTIGLGVTGSIGSLNSLGEVLELDEDIISTSASNATSDQKKIDDMLLAAVNSGGRFFASANAGQLAKAIVTALEGTDPGLTSGAAVALNSGALFNGSMLFQAVFDSADWSGKLDAYLINSATGALPTTPSATFKLPAESSRNIATYGHDGSKYTGVAFTATGLAGAKISDTNTTTLLNAIEPDTTTESNGKTRQVNAISWLRGDVAIDKLTGFRDRTIGKTYKDYYEAGGYSPLGDIIHSAPVYVGQPNSPYHHWPSGTPEADALVSYTDFRADHCIKTDPDCKTPAAASPRREMVYVGANDGMLHMFEVVTTTDDKGNTDPADDVVSITKSEEIAAFVPNSVIVDGNLDNLYSEDYAHRYFVDDTPTVGDAFIDGEWKTILVGGLRGGGKSIYAIDITDPEKLVSDLPGQIMWEYSHPDLGYTYSRPNIVRLQTGEWGIIFGNGYNAGDADGDAKLFIIDAETGGQNLEIILNTEEGLNDAPTTATHNVDVTYKNGLATAAPVDIDGDLVVDLVYAGDLYGNMWRFDVVESNNTTKWETSYHGDPVFSAIGPNNEVQPITTRPTVGRHPTTQGGYMIYFGTGKYIETTDRDVKVVETETQSYYGIWDRDESSIVAFGRDHLLKQEIEDEVTITESFGDLESFDYRITSDNTMSWYEEEGKVPCNLTSCTTIDAQYLGWYMDLVNTALTTYDTDGERQVTDSVLREGRVIFTTLMPDGDICSSSDTGWLMELDSETGSRLEFTPFDVDGDGSFSVSDYYDPTPDDTTNNDGYPVSGRKSTVGILPTPGILSDYSDPTKGKEFKYMSGSSGQIESVTENAGATQIGRQSWLQLFR